MRAHPWQMLAHYLDQKLQLSHLLSQRLHRLAFSSPPYQTAGLVSKVMPLSHLASRSSKV